VRGDRALAVGLPSQEACPGRRSSPALCSLGPRQSTETWPSMGLVPFSSDSVTAILAGPDAPSAADTTSAISEGVYRSLLQGPPSRAPEGPTARA